MSQASLEMTWAPMPGAGAVASASPSEKAPNSSNSKAISKLRSCVVCRTRKVRCDKLSPCSNCRRANISCVYPSKERPPRWARRMERVANNATLNTQPSQDRDPVPSQITERLRNLEGLVKELRGQLEQANAAASSTVGGSSGINSPDSSNYENDTVNQGDGSLDANDHVYRYRGRLIHQDADTTRYVSSRFWSQINDELVGLQMETMAFEDEGSDMSDDEGSPGNSSSIQESGRTPSERSAFLFRHNTDSPSIDLHDARPLPSQIPFLLDVFSENVNSMIRIVHVPTIAKMIRNTRGNSSTDLTPVNEALMFSIYYAAVASMEEEDIMTNFGVTKTDLASKYRQGLEHALAKADFLNIPSLALVQAFAIFLCLVRRHDSPRFVWMMTGLAIRMGQALGLQRDGTHFEHLSPFEVEMRRRAWWVLCVLDVRASEDQATDFMIARGSFDTKLPLNINDADIEPQTRQAPGGHEGITDMAFPLVMCEISEVTKQITDQSAKQEQPNLEEQGRLLEEIYHKLEQGYLQYSVDSGSIAYWVAVTVARLVMAKMTLFVYQPILFSSQSNRSLLETRNRLLVAAIEIAEYNHALNAEQACRHWRWIFQTYTHWYAVVYLLIEASKRPWSPIIERAWTALHSPWLVPAQSHKDKDSRIWVPLRKLTSKAKRHRHAEIERLKGDPQAAAQLELEYQSTPVPASPGLSITGPNAVEIYQERWRQLLNVRQGGNNDQWTPGTSESRVSDASALPVHMAQPSRSATNVYADTGISDPTFEPTNFGADAMYMTNDQPSIHIQNGQRATTANAPIEFGMGQNGIPSLDSVAANPPDWLMNPDLLPWLWAEPDPSIDVLANMEVNAMDINGDTGSEVDWYNWVESAKGMEWNNVPSNDRPS